jgi:hypothetical protein
MSSPQQTFLFAFCALGLAVASIAALPGCSQSGQPWPTTEFESRAATGFPISSATYWVIASNGTIPETGTVAVKAATVLVPLTPLPTGLTYQLTVSGVAGDGGVTGCSGSSKPFTSVPSVGITVTLTCASAPDAGQALLTTHVNSCPVIDGVSANPSSAKVGATMALGVTAHDPDSGPAVLTYQWLASSGTLSGSTTATPTFTCTQPGAVTITVSPSDGDPGCGVNLPFTVACTE